jgi:HPt (histidine-containing phosphotransfer) domain-containing protein
MKTDLSYLQNLSGGSVDVIKEMVGIFIEQVQELSTDMNQSLAEGNWLQLSKHAHKAKSSVAILGMNELAADLKTLEILANDGKETEKYANIVARFTNDCIEAIEELKNNPQLK